MILFHGSNIEINKPDLSHSRQAVDFGPGFYTTPYREQSENWCKRFRKLNDSGIISVYNFDEQALNKLKILQFDFYSEEWLDFVTNCRRCADTTSFDIVIGGIADDKVFDTVELYFDGLIDKIEAIKRLRFEKPNLQICFRTERALSYLRFARSEEI